MYSADLKQQKKLNFQLKKHNLRIVKVRGTHRIEEFGAYYMLDTYRNKTVDTHLDIFTFDFRDWFRIWWE